jgi:O-antigen ligase
MDFVLFILLNAVLFIRPAEVVPALLGLPLYEVLILGCLLAAGARVITQLGGQSLAANPITACVVGLLPAIALSHLSHMYLWGARDSVEVFAKVVLYYLLLVAIVNTPDRLRQFVSWLVLIIATLALIAVCHYHRLITVPSLTILEQHEVDGVTGELIFIPRLRSTGIYNDPNDLGLILVVGLLLGLCRLSDRRSGLLRSAYLPALGLFLYGLVLTKSRGQFLALVAGVLVLFQARYGWRKSLLLAGIALPVLFALSGGRQTSLSTSAGTSQERIQLWSEGLALFRQSPLFGIGHGHYADEVGLVAHNSFVHCFTELGLFGGALFLGTFFCAGWTLWALNTSSAQAGPSELRQLYPYLAAAVFAYVVGLLSLSRPYVVPTYAVVGLAAVVARLAPVSPTLPRLQFNAHLVRRLALASTLFLAGVYVFIRTFARWG